MTDLGPALAAPLTRDRARLDDDRQMLLGGRCGRCAAGAWPRRAVCHRCGGANVAETPIGGLGTLVTWTRVWIGTDEVEAPYVLGLVAIGGIQLFGHVRFPDDLAVHTPTDVRLHVDSTRTPPYWFEVPTDVPTVPKPGATTNDA